MDQIHNRPDHGSTRTTSTPKRRPRSGCATATSSPGARRGATRTTRTFPVVGEELAVARALSELSHQLLAAAAESIEGFVGHRVTLTE